MCQSQCQERNIQQRSRAHVVERLFLGEDNPTLVIPRLFNTSKKEEEEWRQVKKFHMQVRVKDKSTNLIIDNVVQ